MKLHNLNDSKQIQMWNILGPAKERRLIELVNHFLLGDEMCGLVE